MSVATKLIQFQFCKEGSVNYQRVLVDTTVIGHIRLYDDGTYQFVGNTGWHGPVFPSATLAQRWIRSELT